MSKKRIYTPADKMSDIICDNHALLQVMSRFGLPLGFGDYSVEEVCKSHQVDCLTFLAVANFANRRHIRPSFGYGDLSVRSLMDYLKNAHHYFLDFQLPTIRRKLLEAIDCSTDSELTLLVLKFFDSYVDGVRSHMNYEDTHVFTYVENLLEGKRDEEYDIRMFERHHESIDEKLTELKNSIIKYYPVHRNAYLMNSVLFDIFSCEADLSLHTDVENRLFVPAVVQLEEHLKLRQEEVTVADVPRETRVEEEASEDNLSQREKEIIRCVVRGLSNKEIAEELYISVHTVITHRRNIARKLEIHSPTLLTVYAIVNKLVDISEVKLGI